jgi:hypothetical protein
MEKALRVPGDVCSQILRIPTVTCDAFFGFFEFSASKNHSKMQGFVCIMNLCLSAFPIFCYFFYTGDVHVYFWMGVTPQVANLGVPICLLFLNIMLQYFVCCGQNSSPTCARVSCASFFSVIGIIFLALGFVVWIQGEEVRHELVDLCGSTPRTARLEAEWNKLNNFYDKCDPTRQRVITSCAGFRKKFPNRVLAEYLEEMEWDFDCVGFCRFMAKPLFNKWADIGARCATYVGNHNAHVSELVGIPTMALGGGLLAIGICFAGYHNL